LRPRDRGLGQTADLPARMGCNRVQTADNSRRHARVSYLRVMALLAGVSTPTHARLTRERSLVRTQPRPSIETASRIQGAMRGRAPERRASASDCTRRASGESIARRSVATASRARWGECRRSSFALVSRTAADTLALGIRASVRLKPGRSRKLLSAFGRPRVRIPPSPPSRYRRSATMRIRLFSASAM
jgi:hypothetical protein